MDEIEHWVDPVFLVQTKYHYSEFACWTKFVKFWESDWDENDPESIDSDLNEACNDIKHNLGLWNLFVWEQNWFFHKNDQCLEEVFKNVSDEKIEYDERGYFIYKWMASLFKSFRTVLRVDNNSQNTKYRQKDSVHDYILSHFPEKIKQRAKSIITCILISIIWLIFVQCIFKQSLFDQSAVDKVQI